MKILYVLRPNLGSLPPVISQINALTELGHKITLVTSYVNDEDKKIIKELNIDVLSACIKPSDSLFTKLASLYKFRRLLKKSLKKATDSYVWVGSGDTAKYGKKFFLGSKVNVLNLFELYDENRRFLNTIKKIAQKAQFVITPEYCRSNILKVWLKLRKRPLVIPNAPHYFETSMDEKTSKITDMLRNENKRIILYQGWIGGQRSVEKVAEALSTLNNKDDYILVLMGKCGAADAIDILKKKFHNVVHIDHLSPPQHLFVTRLAYIGIATYDDSSLNNIFCAPNKIYEYASFGVPILGRDIPGLKYVVEACHAGICVDFSNILDIIKGINEIDSKHEEFSIGALELNKQVDIKEVLNSMASEFENG